MQEPLRLEKFIKKDGSRMNIFGKRISLLCILIAGLSLGACGPRDKPGFVYMPDMAYSPSVKAQEEGSMRQPVPGTIARGHLPYQFKGNPQGASARLKNPLKKTRTVLNRGREMYGVYCKVCHGEMGEGDGTIVPKFPRPPSLQTDKIRGYSDGMIYHIITEGQNLMPSYAVQVKPKDRWAIIHFLRVLHRAKKPTAADLKALENW